MAPNKKCKRMAEDTPFFFLLLGLPPLIFTLNGSSLNDCVEKVSFCGNQANLTNSAIYNSLF
jgi:hypothetical protein